MQDNEYYNSIGYLIAKVAQLKVELQEARDKCSRAKFKELDDGEQYELASEVESLTRKLDYYSTRVLELRKQWNKKL